VCIALKYRGIFTSNCSIAPGFGVYRIGALRTEDACVHLQELVEPAVSAGVERGDSATHLPSALPQRLSTRTLNSMRTANETPAAMTFNGSIG